MNEKLHIVRICGSLHKNSYNKMLLKTAGKLLPENVEFLLLTSLIFPYLMRIWKILYLML